MRVTKGGTCSCICPWSISFLNFRQNFLFCNDQSTNVAATHTHTYSSNIDFKWETKKYEVLLSSQLYTKKPYGPGLRHFFAPCSMCVCIVRETLIRPWHENNIPFTSEQFVFTHSLKFLILIFFNVGFFVPFFCFLFCCALALRYVEMRSQKRVYITRMGPDTATAIRRVVLSISNNHSSWKDR